MNERVCSCFTDMDKVGARQSKVKRLTDNIKQKNVSPRSLPHMSETAMKRWCEARDTYLDGRYSHLPSPRRIKQKPKVESVSAISHRTARSSTIEFQPLPVEQPQQLLPIVLETVDDHIDTKCVGTETEDSAIYRTEIEQIDEAIQADLPSPQNESSPDNDRMTVENEQEKKKEELIVDEKPIEYDDKATETETETEAEIKAEIEAEAETAAETDLVVDTKEEEEIDLPISNEITVEPIPNEEIPIEPIQDDDTKSMLSSRKSELSLQQQLRRYCHSELVLIRN